MRILFLLSIFIISAFFSQAQKDGYQYSIDLVHVHNNRVSVELKTPRILKKEIVFQFPKIVPGMYSIDDYGRYISRLRAFDHQGHTLPVQKTDEDSWTIQEADKLNRISYEVSGSFGDTTTRQIIFEPGGSDVEAGKVFVLNSHCFLGYFADMTNAPFDITIQHERSMFGSTALTDEDTSATTDHFTAASYNRIVDNPFMYDKPDTSITAALLGDKQSLYEVGSVISMVSAFQKIEESLIYGLDRQNRTELHDLRTELRHYNVTHSSCNGGYGKYV